MTLQMNDILLSHLVEDHKLITRFHWRHVIHTYDDPDTPPYGKLHQECWKAVKTHPITQNKGDACFQECTSGSRWYSERVVKRFAFKHSQKERQYPLALQAAIAFSHPRHAKYFPKFLGWFESERKLLMATEYFPLGDLYTYIEANPPLSEDEASQIASQVARGLQVLHQRGFAHGNLKPQNILIQQCPFGSRSGNWWVKLTDFGVNPSVSTADTSSMMGEAPMPQAPELYETNGNTDHQLADILALGVTIFYILTKCYPQSGEQPPGPGFLSSQLNDYDLSSDCKDLLRGLTKTVPGERLALDLAIQHPWIRDRMPGQDIDDMMVETGSEPSAPSSPGGLEDSEIDVTTPMTESIQESEFKSLGLDFVFGPLDQFKNTDAASYINRPDQFKTPLYLAAEKGNLEIVKLLLEKGADINLGNADRATALHAAAEEGFLEITKFLLESGADSTIRDNGNYTPLWNAANKGHTEIVCLLLPFATKLVLRTANDCGWTAINTAADSGHLEVVILLEEAGSGVIDTPNKAGWTPLNSAAKSGHFEVVRYLLRKGANPSKTTKSGASPLYYAAEKGNLEVVKLLLKAKPGTINKGWDVLVGAAKSGDVNVVEFLISKGADTSYSFGYGKSPLYYAAREGHLSVVKFFLRNVPHLVSITSVDGMTPLNIAAKNGHLDILKMLLEAKLDLLNVPSDEGQTPINSAADNGHLEVVRFLMSKGANMTIRNNDGHTPLNSALNNDHQKVAEFILSHQTTEDSVMEMTQRLKRTLELEETEEDAAKRIRQN